MEFVLAVVFIVLALALLHRLFGPAALGLPALIGILVVAAAMSLAPQLGGATLLLLAVGLVVLFLVMGMAMRIGPTSAEEERSPPPTTDTPVQEPLRDEGAPRPGAGAGG